MREHRIPGHLRVVWFYTWRSIRMIIRTTRGYFFWAVIAFILSIYGCDSKLDSGGADSFFALSCFVFGCILLYWHNTSKRERWARDR
jgi:hypothetical protein